ncbi:MAG: hypothetical protein ABH869_01615 [Candidatus Omnitrophota bacterium]
MFKVSVCFEDMLFSGSVNIPVFDYFEISPVISYSLALYDPYENEYYGGVVVAISY